jgi:hypothetical protein
MQEFWLLFRDMSLSFALSGSSDGLCSHISYAILEFLAEEFKSIRPGLSEKVDLSGRLT